MGTGRNWGNLSTFVERMIEWLECFDAIFVTDKLKSIQEIYASLYLA